MDLEKTKLAYIRIEGVIEVYRDQQISSMIKKIVLDYELNSGNY